jgi:pimeloyl-ACP methyl ester carboxylesterase
MIGLTLVTIHGFWSSPSTWQRLSQVWYADKQLRGLLIDPFRYDSPKKRSLPFSATRVPDFDDIAQVLDTWYRVQLADEPDIAIVTHSQGGLILQRFLARMLHDGRGRELARIRSIVMLACPNSGSDYLRLMRKVLGFGFHPQAGGLKVLDRQVADTQRTVLDRIVNATGVDDHQCRIPFHVYAASSDKIVVAASAQGAFPGTSALPGDHFSVLDPDAPGNCTAQTVRYDILADLAASPAQQIPSPADTVSGQAGALLVGTRGTAEKVRIGAVDSEDAIIGDAEVQQVQEQQVARDLALMQSRQDDLSRQLASLSEQARQLEALTASRISAATAAIMNEVKEASQYLRAETRQLLDQQEKRFDAVQDTDRAERQRELKAFREEIQRDRASRTSGLESAQTALADARVLYDAINSSLPHERFAPGELARLAARLAAAEASVAAGAGEAALAQAQELFLSLDELREEVELKDAGWRAAHLTTTSAVLALVQQITSNSMISVTDEESGASAELDVDYWSDGEFSAIKAAAEQLAERVDAEIDPPTLAELRDISEHSVAPLAERLSRTVATARTRQWASQVRVNVAEIVVAVLEETTGYAWDGDATFAGDDQRAAFYSKLKHPDDSEIVVEVAPGEDGSACLVRVMSFETGAPDDSLRMARIRAIAGALGEHGLSDVQAAHADAPDPAFRDFARIRQRQPKPTASEQP